VQKFLPGYENYFSGTKLFTNQPQEQGDQIGRIFALWAFFFTGQKKKMCVKFGCATVSGGFVDKLSGHTFQDHATQGDQIGRVFSQWVIVSLM
jgi:hypothetical protein